MEINIYLWKLHISNMGIKVQLIFWQINNNISLFVLEVQFQNLQHCNIISVGIIYKPKAEAFHWHQTATGFEPGPRGHICRTAQHSNHSATGQGQ